MGENRESKFYFNVESARVEYMNKIYMFATCMMWVLFLLYSWLKLSWNVINPMVVYGNTALVVAIVVMNLITFLKDKGNKNVYRMVLFQAGIETIVIGGLTDSNNKLVDNIMQLSAATEEVTASADQVREMSESSLKYANTVKSAITKIEESSEDLKQYL